MWSLPRTQKARKDFQPHVHFAAISGIPSESDALDLLQSRFKHESIANKDELFE